MVSSHDTFWGSKLLIVAPLSLLDSTFGFGTGTVSLVKGKVWYREVLTGI